MILFSTIDRRRCRLSRMACKPKRRSKNQTPLSNLAKQSKMRRAPEAPKCPKPQEPRGRLQVQLLSPIVLSERLNWLQHFGSARSYNISRASDVVFQVLVRREPERFACRTTACLPGERRLWRCSRGSVFRTKDPYL